MTAAEAQDIGFYVLIVVTIASFLGAFLVRRWLDRKASRASIRP
jgi:hypothetical protein